MRAREQTGGGGGEMMEISKIIIIDDDCKTVKQAPRGARGVRAWSVSLNASRVRETRDSILYQCSSECS